MAYLGEAGVLVVFVTMLVGLLLGWLSRGFYDGHSMEAAKKRSLDRREQAQARARALEFDLQASQERVAVRESEIGELQSLLSLVEQEKQSLRDRERRLLQRLRDEGKGKDSSASIAFIRSAL